MPAIATARVDCPRCDDQIAVSVETTLRPPKPGTKTAQADLRVVNLAERFAEHYQAAGHTSQ